MISVQNPELQLAFDFVQYTNRHIFLTGKAGTGKTTFLHQLKSISPKRMAVVAPTGVAAVNAGGVTIHSFFQLPFHPFIPESYSGSSQGSQPISFKLGKEKINIIRTLDLLIIDEISMVRSDLLDAIDAVLKRYKNRNVPFGGVQLLMIGDIQQLSPVVKENDWEMLGKYYDTPFFFGSRALQSTDYVTIELKHIYRQQDLTFIDLLNQVRNNCLDSQSLALLNKRYDPAFSTLEHEGYITLTTHNYQSQALNESRLNQLQGKEQTFTAQITDEFPEYAYPTALELKLKTGAQVMFVKNDISRDKLYFNGKIGKIIAIKEHQIVVQCPGESNGISVEKAEWQNMKYSLNPESYEIQETVIGTFVQYPLKLAWAITIHKSQGLTFDHVVIDAHASFAHGQVYVALSRCRTLEGLVLSTPLKNQSIISDHSVSAFTREQESNQPGRLHLLESRRSYALFLISELFDFNPLLRLIYTLRKQIQENQSSLVDTSDKFPEKMAQLVREELADVSGKFLGQVTQLLIHNPEPENNETLQTRISKASAYFIQKITDLVVEPLKNMGFETDNKTVRKLLEEALKNVRTEAIYKSLCLETMADGFEIQKYLQVKARSVLESQQIKMQKVPEKSDSESPHPLLIKTLKKWRDHKSREQKLPAYMILHQKAIHAIVAAMPSQLSDFKKVKGVGKSKLAQYGDELLEIVQQYCASNDLPIKEPVVESEKPDVPKKESRQISYTYFKEGKSISEIATMRNMTANTVEGHIAYYIGTGEIPISTFVSDDRVEIISNAFENQEDFRLSPVKAALGDQVSWGEIRFVLKHLEFIGRVQKQEMSS